MLLSFFKNTNLFTLLTKLLIIIMPFYVIVKVYFDKVLGLGFFGFFIKEFIVIILFLVLIYEYFFNIKNKNIKLKFDVLDYMIFAFIVYGILITLINWLWLENIFYGWRYDFLWFIVLLIFKHWKTFIKDSVYDLIKLFLFWGSISLFLWIMVKFVMWEEILSLFWFSIAISEFWFGWGIPIYQWVEASWIRRFQWILDSPLSMWYFLILFSGLFLHINRSKIDFSILFWIWILFTLIFLTYSRGAMLWVLLSWFILFVLNFKYILKYYKKLFIFLIIIWFLFLWIIWYIFQDKLHNVFLREGSTNGHITRMAKWVDRFLEKPLWAWLATSGPAYRNVIKIETSLETDRYYIPESWFVQILVEGGIIYFSLFMSILWLILLNLYNNKNIYIFLLFIWVLVMNLFLHVFEYTYVTILLFMFLGILYREQSLQKTK
jgi:hypothetical protein